MTSHVSQAVRRWKGRWIRIFLAGCLSFGAITGCGGDNEGLSTGTSLPQPDLSACLERAGADVEIREVDSTSRMVEARPPDGDQIFIGRLPSPGISEKSIQTVRRIRREEGLGGIMTASTVDRGSVLVLVIGREGVEGGVAAIASEQLARKCAIQTGAGVGRPSTLTDRTEVEARSDRISRNRTAT